MQIDNTKILLNFPAEFNEGNFANVNMYKALLFYSLFSEMRIPEVAKKDISGE